MEELPDRLGRFLSPGYKVWDWRLHREGECLLHVTMETRDVYYLSHLSSGRRGANRWKKTITNCPRDKANVIYMVRQVTPTEVAIISLTDTDPENALPSTFLEVL